MRCFQMFSMKFILSVLILLPDYNIVQIILISMQQQPTKTKFIKKASKPSQLKSPTNQEEAKQTTKTHSAMQHLPTIQNMLEIKEEERMTRCDVLFEKVKPFLNAYMQKKIGSRVLQLMFLWGGPNVRGGMQKCILENWKQLIRSKYALYLIEKACKFLDLPCLTDDAVMLQGSWEGAKIVQSYIEGRGDEALQKMKAKFLQLADLNNRGDIKAQQMLHNLSLKAIQKQYDNLILSKMIIRLSVGSMFAEQKEKVLEYLVGKVNEWVGDEEGVRLFIQVVNACDSKQKKTLLRAFKGHVLEIVDLHKPTYVALIKLITEMDDTVFVQKTILKEIEDIFPLMNTKKHACSIIFALFSPRQHNFNILGKYQHSVTKTECKKDEQIRKKQIRSHLYQPLINFLQGENLDELLRHHLNNKLILGILKSLQEDSLHDQYSSFVTKIADHFLVDAKKSIKGDFSHSLTADPSANKIIKNILLLTDEIVDFYCDEFGKLAIQNLSAFLNSKASFVLLGLIQKGGRDYLLSQVKKSRVNLSTVVAGQHYQNLISKKK